MDNIKVKNGVFKLDTKNTSYLFRVNKYGHLEHIHYGKKVSLSDAEALSNKSIILYGNMVTYDENNSSYSLDILPQEISSNGRGDYREPSILLEHNESTMIDFHYNFYVISKGDESQKELPDAYGADESLVIFLKDDIARVEVKLVYSIFSDSDVITRKIFITNRTTEEMKIYKAMSFSLDLSEKDLILMSFHGGWGNEFHLSETKIETGKEVLESRCGFSSNRTNPGFILRKENTDEECGEAWGFNLIYSGNHYSSIERNDKDNIRIMSGISPEDFRWTLKKEETFETPTAVLTYSNQGLNELSKHFHSFINSHIVRGIYKEKERPVLINSWEGFGFNFNEESLLELADEAGNLGFELFVLDDGWFKGRNSDMAGLGDYEVNKEKLPSDLEGLSRKIHLKGMKFGLWLEPEAVSPDSDLYRLHPDWAIENEYPSVYGRHELLLDLTKKGVRNYIVENVIHILNHVEIDYIKWDMNRQLSGVTGEFNHKYILGLYEILERIFRGRNILLESCSAGGNRFDLGMMCTSPQVWTSDNTDAIERIRIQKNASYLYPGSVMGAHVNKEKGDQSLRTIPLYTRFNVAVFGVLGYELDLRKLSREDKEEIRKEIEFYKDHRNTFLYGDFYRIKDDEGKESFEVTSDEETIIAKYRKQISCAPSFDLLRAYGLEKEQNYEIRERLNKSEIYRATGSSLYSGIILNNLYLSTGLNTLVRKPLDYGSELYLIKKKG